MSGLDDIITYIPASENPLSADVGIIKGRKKTWLYDVGSSDAARQGILQIEGDKSIVISHFHPDHMGNLDRIPDVECYVGANTYKYSKRGNVVDSHLYIEDGVRLHIFPIPACHAKGCLGLEVNERYVFLGDSTVPTRKDGRIVYNAQLLCEQIRILEALRAKHVLLSHRMDTLYRKDDIIEGLSRIYMKRSPDSPYIPCEEA